MAIDLVQFDSQIQEQSTDLANQIRQAEEQLMRLKEAYLKVQGANELLNIIQKEQEAESKTKETEIVEKDEEG
jgi:hypothetical protein